MPSKRSSAPRVVIEDVSTSLVPANRGATVLVTQPKKTKRKSRRKSRSLRPTAAFDRPLGSYFRTLTDPFEHGPIRLGWGTLCNTGLNTSVVRGSVTLSAADGSGMFLMNFTNQSMLGVAGLGQPILFSNAGFGAAPLYNGTGTVNNFNANAQTLSQIRPVSASLRVYPQIAATDKPGVVDIAGFAPSANSLGTFTAATANQQFVTSQMEVSRCFATPGGVYEIQWRPAEPEPDYSFSLASTSAATTPFGTWPWIGLSNFPFAPAPTTVFFEAIFHYEYTSTLQNGVKPDEGSGDLVSSEATQDTVINMIKQAGSDFLRSAVKVGIESTSPEQLGHSVGSVAGLAIGAYARNVRGRLLNQLGIGGRANARPMLMSGRLHDEL